MFFLKVLEGFCHLIKLANCCWQQNVNTASAVTTDVSLRAHPQTESLGTRLQQTKDKDGLSASRRLHTWPDVDRD